jgi:hypothetical protein
MYVADKVLLTKELVTTQNLPYNYTRLDVNFMQPNAQTYVYIPSVSEQLTPPLNLSMETMISCEQKYQIFLYHVEEHL